MKTATVENTAKGYKVLDVRGNELARFESAPQDDCYNRNSNDAQMFAHHYRHAPSLLSTLKLKKIKCSHPAYAGRPFWGVQAGVSKGAGRWEAWARVEDQNDDAEDRHAEFKTREEALRWIRAIGGEKVTTRNILNPEAGDIEISRGSKGGCCDPGTERYHSM